MQQLTECMEVHMVLGVPFPPLGFVEMIQEINVGISAVLSSKGSSEFLPGAVISREARLFLKISKLNLCLIQVIGVGFPPTFH